MTTQREVSTLGRALLDQHGLKSWTFGFDNATRRVGQCDYGRRQITVSSHCPPCSPPGQFPASSLITWKANS